MDEIEIRVMPDGRMGIFTQTGTTENGRKKIKEIARQFRLAGIPFVEGDENKVADMVEAHRHDGTDKVRLDVFDTHSHGPGHHHNH